MENLRVCVQNDVDRCCVKQHLYRRRCACFRDHVNILQFEMVVVVCHFTVKMNGLFFFFLTAFFFYQRARTR